MQPYQKVAPHFKTYVYLFPYQKTIDFPTFKT